MTHTQYPSLAKELIELKEADQAMRQKMREGSEWDKEVDIKNTERLKEIIAEIGWPTISKVGAEAAMSAWLLVQHADYEPVFQSECLELMKTTSDDVNPSWVALLEDRMRVNTGRPQLYGTQFYTDESGVFGPRPIEEMEGLEARRKAVGLEPFADYRARMEEVNKRWLENRQEKKS